MSHRRIILLVLCFEAGLAIGLSRFLDPGYVAGALLLGAWILRRSGQAWLAGVALLGIGLGVVSRRSEQDACSALMPEGLVQVNVRILHPVREGIAPGRVEGQCQGEISLRIRGERLVPAGSRWEAVGRWLRFPGLGGRPGGLFVVRELRPLPGTPSFDARFRNWLSGTITRLYGTRAGLVDALLTGSRGELDPVLRAAFARSGLVHLLAISGFHVGIVFGWTVLLLKLLGAPRHRRSAGAALVAFAYVAFLGWPAPATRAAFLCGLGAWSASRQRHPAPLALLAVTCLGVTLVDPWALFQLGAWLSAAAFFGTMVFTRWSDRAVGRAAGWRMLFASIGATLSTAPITALALGSVALAGIGLNFGAIPLAALAVPAVILSVVTAPLPIPVSQAFAAGGGLGLAGLERLATVGSAVPFGAMAGEAGVWSAMPWLLLLGFALWVLGWRNTSRRAALRLGWGTAAGGLVLLLPLHRIGSAYEGDGLALHFLSVGQGDAALIRTPRGHWILVDAGPAERRRDAGRQVVLPFLVRHGVRRLAAVVVSHAHLDHVGGVPAVLERIPAELILEPAEPVSERHYLRMLELAETRGMRWRAGRAGDSLVIDGVVLRVIHPDTLWSRWGQDLNDDSVVLYLRSGSFEAVLAGDLGIRAESLLAGRVGRVDVLKVGHHGSAYSTGVDWIRELRPKVAVISVGPNRYGHPAPAALSRLAEQGVDVWRTDRDGNVAVTLRDSTMTLRGRTRTGHYVLVP